MLVLSDSDLKQALPMKECIEAMRLAFRELSCGEAIIPTRLNLDASEEGYVGLFMPAYSPNLDRSSVKIVSVNSQNPSKNRPLIQATLVLNAASTGDTLSTMNGDVLTNVRTAAGSGVATDLLSNPDSKVLGIIGTGALARTHLDAVLAVRGIEKVMVRGRSTFNTSAFIEESRDKYQLNIMEAESDEDFRSCDIICTVTNSDNSVLDVNMLKEDVHINAVGTYKPHTRELSEEVVLKATLVVDEREACLTEPGDIMIPIQEGKMDESHIYAELGELLAEKKEDPSYSELTIFKSVGNGIQDVYAADLAYRTAVDKGIGTRIEMD